jgi:hypothetical protein
MFNDDLIRAFRSFLDARRAVRRRLTTTEGYTAV